MLSYVPPTRLVQLPHTLCQQISLHLGNLGLAPLNEAGNDLLQTSIFDDNDLVTLRCREWIGHPDLAGCLARISLCWWLFDDLLGCRL